MCGRPSPVVGPPPDRAKRPICNGRGASQADQACRVEHREPRVERRAEQGGNPRRRNDAEPPICDDQIQGTQLLGPEFKILNTSTSISRINFVNDLVYGSVSQGTKTNISSYVGVASDVNKLLDLVSLNMLHGQMSDGMRSTLASTLTAITDNTRRAQAALYLTGSSSQFQVEH